VWTNELRTTADYLYGLADRARANGSLARAAALEQIADDYEAQIAAAQRQQLKSVPTQPGAVPEPPQSAG